MNHFFKKHVNSRLFVCEECVFVCVCVCLCVCVFVCVLGVCMCERAMVLWKL